MTVEELINELRGFDKNVQVRVNGRHGVWRIQMQSNSPRYVDIQTGPATRVTETAYPGGVKMKFEAVP